MFTVVRLYSDENGESRFEDIEVPLKDGGPIGYLSQRIPVQHLMFREVAPTYNWGFHNAPERQYIILLDGNLEIETSLGEIRQFKPGDILLVEDTIGRGHISRNIRPVVRRSLFVTLPD